MLPGARIGASCNIGDHAFIESGAVIGERVTVKNSCLIWDGVTIEDDAFIGPNVVFTNARTPRVRRSDERHAVVPTRVGRGASIGANATVVCGVMIGEYSMVGAGAVITKDVPANALVAGNPARQIGSVCRCGRRLVDGVNCPCGRPDRTPTHAGRSTP